HRVGAGHAAVRVLHPGRRPQRPAVVARGLIRIFTTEHTENTEEEKTEKCSRVRRACLLALLYSSVFSSSVCSVVKFLHNNSSITLPPVEMPRLTACSLVMPATWCTVAARSAGDAGRSCGNSPFAELAPTTRPPA